MIQSSPRYAEASDFYSQKSVYVWIRIAQVAANFYPRKREKKLPLTSTFICPRLFSLASGKWARRDSSVRSIVVQTPWSGVCTRFTLTNSGRLPAALPTGKTLPSFARSLIRKIQQELQKPSKSAGKRGIPSHYICPACHNAGIIFSWRPVQALWLLCKKTIVVRRYAE